MNDTHNSRTQGNAPGFDLERKLAQNTRTLVVGPYLTERAAARAGNARLSPREAGRASPRPKDWRAQSISTLKAPSSLP